MEKDKSEWFNDSEFWEQYAPIMFDEAHWEEVSAVGDGIVRLARLGLYGREYEAVKILDLCCGPGRISGELARRGFAVTGVDITESYLETAREEAASEKLNIEYIKADSRDFSKRGFFDIAVNLYISFGYFEDKNEDLRLARNVYESLKEGGCFIIETLGKETAARDFTEAEWFERAGFMVLTQYELLDSWSLLKNRWVLIKDGKKIEKTFTQRLYAASELKALLHEAGFSKVEVYGNWDEDPYDHKAAKLIVVGRKGSCEK